MAPIIGIRREDKNKWERRVPLSPSHLAELKQTHDIDFIVQPSPIRIFTDDEYRQAGATVDEDLGPADVVLAVKEIPVSLLTGPRAFVCRQVSQASPESRRKAHFSRGCLRYRLPSSRPLGLLR